MAPPRRRMQGRVAVTAALQHVCGALPQQLLDARLVIAGSSFLKRQRAAC